MVLPWVHGEEAFGDSGLGSCCYSVSQDSWFFTHDDELSLSLKYSPKYRIRAPRIGWSQGQRFRNPQGLAINEVVEREIQNFRDLKQTVDCPEQLLQELVKEDVLETVKSYHSFPDSRNKLEILRPPLPASNQPVHLIYPTGLVGNILGISSLLSHPVIDNEMNEKDAVGDDSQMLPLNYLSLEEERKLIFPLPIEQIAVSNHGYFGAATSTMLSLHSLNYERGEIDKISTFRAEEDIFGCFDLNQTEIQAAALMKRSCKLSLFNEHGEFYSRPVDARFCRYLAYPSLVALGGGHNLEVFDVRGLFKSISILDSGFPYKEMTCLTSNLHDPNLLAAGTERDFRIFDLRYPRGSVLRLAVPDVQFARFERNLNRTDYDSLLTVNREGYLHHRVFNYDSPSDTAIMRMTDARNLGRPQQHQMGRFLPKKLVGLTSAGMETLGNSDLVGSCIFELLNSGEIVYSFAAAVDEGQNFLFELDEEGCAANLGPPCGLSVFNFSHVKRIYNRRSESIAAEQVPFVKLDETARILQSKW